MKFVVRLKATFATNNEFGFDKNKSSKIKGDEDFFSSDIFIIGDDLFTCRTTAVNAIREFEKALVGSNDAIKKQITEYLRAAIKSIQLEQKCNLVLNGPYEGTEITYAQIVADDVIEI